MNNFSAIGRIGKDAQTRYTQGGKAVTGWSLAVDKGWGDNKQTLWFDCSLWGERGIKVAEHIKKGGQLGVTGEVGTREHDGKTYLTLEVREVSLVSGSEAKRQESKPKSVAKQETPDYADDDIPFDGGN